jgi:hypothetical protein
VRGSKPVGKQ